MDSEGEDENEEIGVQEAKPEKEEKKQVFQQPAPRMKTDRGDYVVTTLNIVDREPKKPEKQVTYSVNDWCCRRSRRRNRRTWASLSSTVMKKRRTRSRKRNRKRRKSLRRSR